MELVLLNLSATREKGPRLLCLRSWSGLPCEDLERKRLLLLDSLRWTDTAEALLSMWGCCSCGCCSGAAWAWAAVSKVEAVVGVEAGDGGGGRKLMRAFECRFELFEKPPGLNRPAVA